MTALWITIFLLSAGSFFHTYLFYPALLHFLSKKKRPDRPRFEREDSWPRVSVLLSVYNEEAVFEKKLQTIFQSDYPAHLLEIYVGSDASSDRTNELVAPFF